MPFTASATAITASTENSPPSARSVAKVCEQRAGIGEPAGLDHHAAEMRHRAALALGDQAAQRDLQVGAHDAAQAAVAEQHGFVGCWRAAARRRCPTAPNSLTTTAVPVPSGVVEKALAAAWSCRRRGSR